LRIQITFTEPGTGEQRQPVLELPVAIGKDFNIMPSELNGEQVSRLVIKDNLIADYHALIFWENNELIINNQRNANGFIVNNQQVTNAKLQNHDLIQIGICTLSINFDRTSITSEGNSESICEEMIGFLFKRRCGRTDRTNCGYCQNNTSTNTNYYEEYSYYEGYGNYQRGYWGNDYYQQRENYSYNPETGNVDFTEADSTSFEEEIDGNFETDMGAS
jgi:FHA domain